ncbi:MAG: hypothetical protein M1837_002480 [Sclerophora amabilis]|nr:MAG: hypothetical protein M1837_002480 [Sclerophora amabilis]
MSLEGPDPKSFKTWDEAFQYPIPAVRRMEQQLQGDLAANRDRLRTLVGASYRDLLGTAERIIEMDEDMQRVETRLGSVSQRCNSRVLEKIGRNFRKWESGVKAEAHERYFFASQLSILQSCPLVITRLLRQGDSTLLASKVLILSKNLHKALNQVEGAPPLIDSLRRRLGSLESKILRHVDRQFSHTGTTPSALVDAMCAFSLATISTSTDVLRHFHHKRSEAIMGQLERRQDYHGSVIRALKLYIRTLQDTQSVLPRRLGQALLKLRSQPLRKDPSVRALVELNIDVHEEWISNDVKNFTPWLRHDDLQKTESDRLLQTWAARTFSTLLGKLKVLLSDVDDFPILIKLRTEVLEIWFDGQKKTAGFASSEAIEGLRATMNDQLVRLIRGRTSQLRPVCVDIMTTLRGLAAEYTDPSEGLWEASTTSMDIGNGAVEFKQTILDRWHGRSDDITRVIRGYHSWLESMKTVSSMIKELKGQRWDDDLDDDEDEFGLDSRNAALSEDDPQMLEEELSTAISAAFQKFESTLEQEVKTTSSDIGSSQATFLLRVLREIRDHVPQHGKTLEFGLSVVPTLHSAIGELVSARPLRSYQRALQKRASNQKVPSRGLWEGTPQLPVLPSPSTFKFLHDLVLNMAESGSDIWSPSSTKALKITLRSELQTLLRGLINTNESRTLVNGDRGVEGEGVGDDPSSPLEADNTVDGTETDSDSSPRPTEGSSIKDDARIQLLFDVCFLRKVLSTPGMKQDEDSLGLIERDLTQKTDLSESLAARLQKSVQDYWKRTNLLFALIA